MKWKRHAALLALELIALAFLAPSPALRAGGGWLTPYGLCVAAAALAGVWMFERLRIVRAVGGGRKDGPIGVIFRVDALELALWCFPCGLIGGRLLYCLFRPGYYGFDAGLSAVLCTWEGGFLLWGAAGGVLGAAAALARRKKTRLLPLLDDLAAPGLLVVALCRLAEGLAGEGLGAWMENPAFARFPIAVQNAYGEWQLAVFLFEALAALAMMIAVLRIKGEAGRRIEAALMIYACAQVFFESLRMDGCLRIGFVRVSQVLSAVVILTLTCASARRRVGTAAACMALIGVIEWALDKTQVSSLLLYGGMILLCACMAAGGLGAGTRNAEESSV